MDRPSKRRKGKSLDGGGAGFAMPLTERQQMAYLLSMTAKEGKNDDSGEDIQEAKKVRKLSPLSRINRPKNKSGETQLHIAATKGDLEATKNLIRQGADVNCRDNADWTPLHEACNHGHYKVAKVLLRSGAHVNVAGLDGDTPLHDASANAHLKVVLLLLRHGANPHQKNDAGESPIDVADGKEIDEALRNFTSEMLLDLKPTKDFTLEAQKSKYRHSETSGKTDKPSHSGTVKTHRRLISNKADFLDADNIEDFEELSTTGSDISKHNTLREEAATEKKTEKMQADIRTGKFEEKKEKLHDQGKQTEKRHKKLDKPDSFDKKVLLVHTNKEAKHQDGHKKKHHKHDKIPSRDIEQKFLSESPDKWKQKNRLNLKDFVLKEDNDIPNRLIEEHPGKYMKDMKQEDRVKVLKDSSQHLVDNERKERKDHELKIKKDKKLHTTKHPDKIQKKKEPSTPKKKNNLVRVKGFLDDSDDEEEPEHLTSFQLFKTESPQEKVRQESAIGTKIESKSSLKDEFIGKNLISRSEQLVKQKELKVKSIPTKAKLKHVPSDIWGKKEQSHEGEVETLSFTPAFDSESITSHSRHDKPYLHPTSKQHEVKKNLFSSKQSEAIKQIPAKKQRDLNKETTSAKSKDALKDSLAPEQKTKIDEPSKTSLAHDKGLLNKIKTASFKHSGESYGNDIVKQKESNIEESRDDLKNVLLLSHKDLTTKPKHKEGKSVHSTKKENQNSTLSTPHKDGSLLKVKPKKEMNSTVTAPTVTMQPIRKEHKQLLHSESKRKEHMDQELDSSRDVIKDSNKDTKSNMHKMTSSASKHTSKQTESSPAKGSHTATPQKQHDDLNAFYHSHYHKSSVPGQVEINLFSSVEKSAKKSSKHSERKHKLNDTKISPHGTVFKKVSKKLKVDGACADKEEHGKKHGAAQTHSNDSPDTISEDTSKEKKKGGDVIVKHHKKHKDKSKDILKDKKKTSELSALSTEQQDYLKSEKHSDKYSYVQKSFKQGNKLMSETKAENKRIKEESGTFGNLSIVTKADTLSHVKHPDFCHAFKESPTDNKTEKKIYLDSDDIIMSAPQSSKPQKVKTENGFEPKIVETDKKIVLTQKTSAQVKSSSENSANSKTDNVEKQENKPSMEEIKISGKKQHTDDTGKSASATMDVTVHEHILTCGPKHKHKLLHHLPNKELATDTAKKKHKRKSTESDTYINKVKKKDLQEASKPVPLKEPLKESLSLPSALPTNLKSNSDHIKSPNSLKRDRSRSLENVAAKEEGKPSELTTCQKMVMQKALESATSEPNKAGSSKEFKTNIVDPVTLLPVDKNLRKKDTVPKNNSKKDEDEVVHKGIRLKEVDLNMKVGLNDNALRGLDNIKKKKKKRSSDKDSSVECKISKLTPELITTDHKINTVSSDSSHEMIKNVPLGSNHNKNSQKEHNASQVGNLEKKTDKTLPSKKEKVQEGKYLKSSIDTAKAIHLSAKVQPKVVVANLQLTMPEEKHVVDASDNLKQQQQNNYQLQQQLLLKEQDEQRKQQEKREQLKEIQQEEQIRNENLMYEENEDAVENLLHMEDSFGTDSAFENEVKPNSPTMLFNSNAFVVPSNSNELSQDVDDGISEDSSSEKINISKEITKVVEHTNLCTTMNEICIKKTYDNISSPEQISTMQHLHTTDIVVHNTMTQNASVATILPEVESSVLKVDNDLYQIQKQKQEQSQILQQQNKNEPPETILSMKDQSQEQFLPQWKHSNQQLVQGQSKYIQAEQELFSDQVQLSIYKQLHEKQERLVEKTKDQQSQLPSQLLKQQHFIEQEQDITGKFQHLENWELQELQHAQAQFSEKRQNQQFVEKHHYECQYEQQQQQQQQKDLAHQQHKLKNFAEQHQQQLLAEQQPKVKQLVKHEQRQLHFRAHEHKQDQLEKHQYLSEQQKTLPTGKQQREHLLVEQQKQWNTAEQQQKQHLGEQQLKQQLLSKQQQKMHLKEQQQKQQLLEEQQQKQRVLAEQQKQHLAKEQQKRQKVVEHQQHLSKEQQKQQLIAEQQQKQQLLAKEQRKQQLLAKEQRKKQLLADEQQKQQHFADQQQKQQKLAEHQKQRLLAEQQKQQQLAEKQKQLLVEQQQKQQLLSEQQQKQQHLADEQRKQQLLAEQQKQLLVEQQQKQQLLAEEQQKQQQLAEQQKQQHLADEHRKQQLLAEQQKQLLVEQQQKQQRLAEQQQKQFLAEQQQKHQLLAEQQQEQYLAEQQQKQQLLAEQQQKQQLLQQLLAEQQQKQQLLAEQQQKQQRLAEQQQKQLLAEQQQKHQLLAEQQQEQHLAEQQQKQQLLAEQQQKQHFLVKQQKEQLLAEQQKQLQLAEHKKQQQLAEQQKQQRLADEQRKQKLLAEQQQKQQHLAEEQRKQKVLAEQQQKQQELAEKQKKLLAEQQQKQQLLAEQQQKQQLLAEQQQKHQPLAEQQQKQHFLVKQQKEQLLAEQQKPLQDAEHKKQQLEEQHKKQNHFVEHKQKQQAPFKMQHKQNHHAEVQKNQEHFSKQQEEPHSVEHKQKEQPNLGKHQKHRLPEIQKGNLVPYNPAPDEQHIKQPFLEKQQKKQDFVQQQQKQKLRLEQQIEQHHLEEQHQKQVQIAIQKQNQQDFPEKQQEPSQLADHQLIGQPILSVIQNKEHSKKRQKQNLLSDKQKQQQPAEQHQKQLQFTEQQKQQQLLEKQQEQQLHSAGQQCQTFEQKYRKQQRPAAGSQAQPQQQKSQFVQLTQDLKETVKLEHVEKLKAKHQPQHPSCVKQGQKLPELKHEETKEGVSVQKQVTEKQMPQIQRLENKKQYEKEKSQKEEQSQQNNVETKIVHTQESNSKKPAIDKQLTDIPKQEIVNSDISFTSKQLKKESDAKENTDKDDQKHAFNKLELSTHFNKNEEFSGLVSPSTDADHVSFANRYHDLDAIDASDLLKTEKHSDELIATSFKDQTHLHDSAIVGISRCLSSEEIISKVADCILELDEHDNTFTLRQYIPVHSTTSGNLQQDNILPSVVTSSLSCSESCSNLTVSQVFHHGANEFNTYSHDAPVFEETKYAGNHGQQPAPVADQHVTEPLFVNTVSARLSSSEEKLYSPKHISDGEKLYSPRTSVSSDDGKRYRKVNLEPCDMLRTLINSDLPVVPQVPVQETKKNETNETQQSVTASPVKTRNSSAVVKTEKKPAAVKALQTWRETVKSQCSVISMNDYQRNVDSILASVLKPKKYEDILKEAGDNKQLRDLLMQHASQLEKLKISMIQELSRVESNCRLLIQEKGPVGAATVIYFQRDHASRNLGRTLNFTNKATHMPDIEKLRDARLSDLQDKYEKMMKTLLSQHRLEVDTLKQTQKMDTLLDQQEMLRQRYMRLRYKINR